jgi:hypothetical protein
LLLLALLICQTIGLPLRLAAGPPGQSVLVVNVVSGRYDAEGASLKDTVALQTSGAVLVNLATTGDVASVLTNAHFDQVWVYDISANPDDYPDDWKAIADWYKQDMSRPIICDGRILSSIWGGRWTDEGARVSQNYYENLRTRGGGLVLGTDDYVYHPGLNTLNAQLGLDPFSNIFGLGTIPVDQSNPVMNTPNLLGPELANDSSPGQVPAGLQPNGLILYPIAFQGGNLFTPGISTTIKSLSTLSVTITAPANGTTVEEASTVTFTATATGGTGPYTLSWNSSLQGSLGNGESLTLSNLVPGDHIVSVTAVDAENHVDVASIHVIVKPLPPPGQSVLVVNVAGAWYDAEGRELYETVRLVTRGAAFVNLAAPGDVQNVLTNAHFDQVWVFDLSPYGDPYPDDWQAIADWFKRDTNRPIICDARMISSIWNGRWTTEGALVSQNYYENLRSRGGGLVLGTDHDAFHPGINTLNADLGLDPFSGHFFLATIPVDQDHPLMNAPNRLGPELADDSTPGQAPSGLQPNGLVLYPVGFQGGNHFTPGISTTIKGSSTLQVTITAPATGTTVEVGTPLTFTASAWGGTGPYTLTWSSSLQGNLGAGETINPANLGPGDHIITVTALDTANHTDVASIHVTIKPPPPPGQAVLVVNVAGGDHDEDGEHLFDTVRPLTAGAVFVNLAAPGDVERVLTNAHFDQVWVFDLSERPDEYLVDWQAIADWCKEVVDRPIICDARLLSSLWKGRWTTGGGLLAQNYYERFRSRGGGLLLATGDQRAQTGINTINARLGLAPFQGGQGSSTMLTDQENPLLGAPNALGPELPADSGAGQSPLGLQPNGTVLYPGAIPGGQPFTAGLSTSFRSSTLRVSVSEPANGTTVEQGRPVVLRASVGGRACGCKPHWKSSLQGDLGEGDSISPDDLVPGDHIITVTVVDEDGHADVASIHLTVKPLPPPGQAVLVINVVGGIYDGDGANLYEAVHALTRNAVFVNLATTGDAASVLTNAHFDQVWVFDLSHAVDDYPDDWKAIADWYKQDMGRPIICDARIISSIWGGRWTDEGARVSQNYYENLRTRGGGLMLGTDHYDYHSGINTINAQLGLDPFSNVFSLATIPVDQSNPVMNTPNLLGPELFDDSTPGQVPAGLQPNGLLLYPIAFQGGNLFTPGISTTIKGSSSLSVAITSPAGGATVEAGTSLTFSAAATSGTGPYTLTWSSSLQGSLGSGESLTLSNLTPGDHTVTVTAVDAENHVAIASIHVIVNRSELVA